MIRVYTSAQCRKHHYRPRPLPPIALTHRNLNVYIYCSCNYIICVCCFFHLCIIYTRTHTLILPPLLSLPKCRHRRRHHTPIGNCSSQGVTAPIDFESDFGKKKNYKDRLKPIFNPARPTILCAAGIPRLLRRRVVISILYFSSPAVLNIRSLQVI
jgi:hypothetical protein